MALPGARDLDLSSGRLRTPHGDALFCLQCATNSEPTFFTYLHGFYVQSKGDVLRELLREVGANYSSRNNRVMCPYCVSYDDYGVHEGFFRLWRSVELPRAQFADAWAAVDKTGWKTGGRSELLGAAEALWQGPRLPMMLGRDGPEGTPASVLLARARASLLGPAVSVQAAAGAPSAAAYSTYPSAKAASRGSPYSATPPTDAARLASLEARLASSEAELQRLAAAVAALKRARW
jgi:hypothetical protein